MYVYRSEESQTLVVDDSLLIVTPLVGFCNCSMFCCALLCVHSSFAIILMGKRELVALLFSLVSLDCCVALPHSAMGLFAVCDCGISYSYCYYFCNHMLKVCDCGVTYSYCY